jgi:hypothetical protein
MSDIERFGTKPSPTWSGEPLISACVVIISASVTQTRQSLRASFLFISISLLIFDTTWATSDATRPRVTAFCGLLFVSNQTSAPALICLMFTSIWKLRRSADGPDDPKNLFLLNLIAVRCTRCCVKVSKLYDRQERWRSEDYRKFNKRFFNY